MRASTALVAAIASLVGLASAGSAQRRFTTQGKPGNAAFAIPPDTPDGVYAVQVASSGFAVHYGFRAAATAINNDSLGRDDTPPPPPPPAAAAAVFAQGPGAERAKRDPEWLYDCGNHKSIDINATNKAIAGLRDQCHWRRFTRGKVHVYSVQTAEEYYRGGRPPGQKIAAFYCNYKVDRYCWDTETERAFVHIPQVCGHYREGWVTLNHPDPMFSVGYHELNENYEFCGKWH